VQVAMTLSENTFPFTKLIDFISDLGVAKKEKEEAKKEVIALLKERANSFIKSNGISYDKVNAVTNLSIDDLPTYFERAKVLEKHANDDKFKDIVIAHKRIHNILDKSREEVAEINKDFFFDAAETGLFESAKETEHLTIELLKQRDYEAIIHLLYLFVPTVNKFFDNVLVMIITKVLGKIGLRC
jgi:glycyl-tRNA synthetase beta chain